MEFLVEIEEQSRLEQYTLEQPKLDTELVVKLIKPMVKDFRRIGDWPDLTFKGTFILYEICHRLGLSVEQAEELLGQDAIFHLVAHTAIGKPLRINQEGQSKLDTALVMELLKPLIKELREGLEQWPDIVLDGVLIIYDACSRLGLSGEQLEALLGRGAIKYVCFKLAENIRRAAKARIAEPEAAEPALQPVKN